MRERKVGCVVKENRDIVGGKLPQKQQKKNITTVQSATSCDFWARLQVKLERDDNGVAHSVLYHERSYTFENIYFLYYNERIPKTIKTFVHSVAFLCHLMFYHKHQKL